MNGGEIMHCTQMLGQMTDHVTWWGGPREDITAYNNHLHLSIHYEGSAKVPDNNVSEVSFTLRGRTVSTEWILLTKKGIKT